MRFCVFFLEKKTKKSKKNQTNGKYETNVKTLIWEMKNKAVKMKNMAKYGKQTKNKQKINKK